MAEQFDWSRIPFYTAQKVLQNLSYSDVENLISAIPRLQPVFEETNTCPKSKFIFDGNEDELETLNISPNIEQIYINLRKITIEDCFKFIRLLNSRPKLRILFIKDDFYLAKNDNLKKQLTVNFTYLTHLSIESDARSKYNHTISNLLKKCTNLQELSYKYGNLKPHDMQNLWHLRKLKLISVEIDSEFEFKKALRSMSQKLQHFECYPDVHTLAFLHKKPYDIIFNSLKYLKKLHTFKTIAFANSHHFANLPTLPNLKNLSIITLRNNFLPALYDSINHVTAEKISIEEWQHPNLQRLILPSQKQRRLDQMRILEETLPNFAYTRKVSLNHNEYIPLL